MHHQYRLPGQFVLLVFEPVQYNLIHVDDAALHIKHKQKILHGIEKAKEVSFPLSHFFFEFNSFGYVVNDAMECFFLPDTDWSRIYFHLTDFTACQAMWKQKGIFVTPGRHFYFFCDFNRWQHVYFHNLHLFQLLEGITVKICSCRIGINNVECFFVNQKHHGFIILKIRTKTIFAFTQTFFSPHPLGNVTDGWNENRTPIPLQGSCIDLNRKNCPVFLAMIAKRYFNYTA